MSAAFDSSATPVGGLVDAPAETGAPPYELGRIPEERSLLWSPSKARTGGDEPGAPYRVAIDQAALKRVRDHIASALEGEVGGLLLGRLFECPDTGRRWVRVEDVVRVSEPLSETAGAGELGAVLSPVLLRAQADGGHPVGWYHSHRRLGVFLSESEAQFHQGMFREPWHLAMVVLTSGARPAGGVFQALANGELPRGGAAPFHELLVDSSFLPDGRKRTFAGWQNYTTSSPVGLAGQGGVSAVIPKGDRPPAPPLTAHMSTAAEAVEPAVAEPEAEEAPEPTVAKAATSEEAASETETLILQELEASAAAAEDEVEGPSADQPSPAESPPSDADPGDAHDGDEESEEIVYAAQVKQTLSAVEVTLGPSLAPVTPGASDGPAVEPEPPASDQADSTSERQDREAPPVQWPSLEPVPVSSTAARERRLPLFGSQVVDTLWLPVRAIDGALGDLPRRVRLGILASAAAVTLLSAGWLLWTSLTGDAPVVTPAAMEAAEATDVPGQETVDPSPSTPGVPLSESAGANDGPVAPGSGELAAEDDAAAAAAVTFPALEAGIDASQSAAEGGPVESEDEVEAPRPPPDPIIVAPPDAALAGSSAGGSPIAGAGGKADSPLRAFQSSLEVFTQETAGYGRQRGDFDRGEVGCNALNSRYRSVDEAFFRLSRAYVSARVELGDDALSAYDGAGRTMDEIDRHYDATGCPRPR